MAFEVKKHSKEEFFDTYCRWSLLHKFPLANKEMFPETALVLYKDDLPIYAIWFWFTNSKICIATFMLSNKGVNYKKRIGGKKALMLEVINYAKKKKQLLIYCPTTSKEVIETLLEVGFNQGDSDSSQYFLKLV
jgi:hypothetical protein